MCVHIILHMQHENYNKVNMWFDDVKPGPLTWEIPDSNSSGFSPLGFTILALVLNMAFVSAVRNLKKTCGLNTVRLTWILEELLQTSMPS